MTDASQFSFPECYSIKMINNSHLDTNSTSAPSHSNQLPISRSPYQIRERDFEEDGPKDDTAKDDTSEDDLSEDDSSEDDTAKDDTAKDDMAKDDTESDDRESDYTESDDMESDYTESDYSDSDSTDSDSAESRSDMRSPKRKTRTTGLKADVPLAKDWKDRKNPWFVGRGKKSSD